MTGRLSLALLSVCLLLQASGRSDANARLWCKQDWVCVEESQDGGNVELFARNLQNYPVTYTLRVHGVGYAIDGADTVTRTLAPRASQRAMSLRANGSPVRADYSVDLAWAVGDMHANHDDDHLYAFPYTRGRTYRILQGYGSRFSHRGREEFAVDFDMEEGTPVHAARGGIVAHVVEEHDRGCWDNGCGAYANFIVVLHNDGTTGEYYHLQQNGAIVAAGDSVRRGQMIGYSGNTGHTAMPHLHFAVYRATSWGNTQSIPVRFQSADGIVDVPRRGARHQAAY